VVVRANDHLGGGAAPGLIPESELTPREWEVYALLVEGLSNKEIAERLIVSVHTTKVHVHKVLAKLGVRDRIGLMRMATAPAREADRTETAM
jgi:DNA-binding NarL/FixJ family response regulator